MCGIDCIRYLHVSSHLLLCAIPLWHISEYKFFSLYSFGCIRRDGQTRSTDSRGVFPHGLRNYMTCSRNVQLTGAKWKWLVTMEPQMVMAPVPQPLLVAKRGQAVVELPQPLKVHWRRTNTPRHHPRRRKNWKLDPSCSPCFLKWRSRLKRQSRFWTKLMSWRRPRKRRKLMHSNIAWIWQFIVASQEPATNSFSWASCLNPNIGEECFATCKRRMSVLRGSTKHLLILRCMRSSYLCRPK